ncbi:low affinity immunoglobulin gamma Fc region receptor III-like isoform X2 [Channa argus]|uniref:low affinity immunoglobulin gamma Fc region receptor III-like isoform X2 n=1 Tax=Channa argus TaxID=215402 RepID=UPI0035208C42
MLSQQQDNMEATAFCFRLMMLKFLLLGKQVQSTYSHGNVFLRITPDTLQRFEYDPVSFNCESSDGSTALRGIRDTKEFKPVCNNKRTASGSICAIDKAYAKDSGLYWCETEGGARSNTVNITVTAESVILESPALVFEGDDVTLRCRTKTTSTNQIVHFYKNNVRMNSSSAEKKIDNVSKSDEGLYKCSVSVAGTSQGSWLVVRISIISPSLHKGPLSRDSEAHNILISLFAGFTIFMLFLVLLWVGILHIRKHRVDEEPDDSDPNRVTYAVVVRKQKQDQGADDNTSLKTNQSREPQIEIDDDESSHQLIYAAVTIRTNCKPASGLSSSMLTLNPPADKDLPEEVLYSPIRMTKKNGEN